MIEIHAVGRNTRPMNPIAFIEVTAATRHAVQGAGAKDPVVLKPKGGAGAA